MVCGFKLRASSKGGYGIDARGVCVVSMSSNECFHLMHCGTGIKSLPAKDKEGTKIVSYLTTHVTSRVFCKMLDG